MIINYCYYISIVLTGFVASTFTTDSVYLLLLLLYVSATVCS